MITTTTLKHPLVRIRVKEAMLESAALLDSPLYDRPAVAFVLNGAGTVYLSVTAVWLGLDHKRIGFYIRDSRGADIYHRVVDVLAFDNAVWTHRLAHALHAPAIEKRW